MAVESGSALSRSITLLDPDLADSLATRLQDMSPSGAVSEVQQIGDLVDLIPDGLPARPRGLKGSSTGTGIKLSWDARGATQWRVLLDGSFAADVSQPEVTIPATVGTHDVAVCATGSGSSTSRAARATVEVAPSPTPVAPAAPTGVSAKRAGKSVSLSWTPPSGPVTLYVVEGRYGSQWRVIGTSKASPFKVTRTAVGSASQLRVAAVNGAGQGPWSSAVAVPR